MSIKRRPVILRIHNSICVNLLKAVEIHFAPTAIKPAKNNAGSAVPKPKIAGSKIAELFLIERGISDRKNKAADEGQKVKAKIIPSSPPPISRRIRQFFPFFER